MFRPAFVSKFSNTYSKLLQGLSPKQISKDDTETFYHNLFGLNIDRKFLENELGRVPKDTLLAGLKSFCNNLFSCCITEIGSESDTTTKSNALETLCIFLRAVFRKNPSGWEVVEICAGSAERSDTVFMSFARMISQNLTNSALLANIRHQVVQTALVFMCGVSQLSPGAYLLRDNDLYPALVSFIKSPETDRYAFEATLLLSILANFHKSDAAKLNPYLRYIRDSTDEELVKKILWASNFALDAVIKNYQEISNDEISPSFTTTLSSLLTSLRPDHAFASTEVDPPRELFKDQPIETCVILLPLYEFMHTNSTFVDVLLTSSSSLATILTLSSYILTHATSLASTRSISYAQLSLSCLLVMAENDMIMEYMCQPVLDTDVRICRQRLPHLPIPKPKTPLLCYLLDCCVLWLRHNLHMRLEVSLYILIIWYLQSWRIRLEYHWNELWKALLGMMSFLTSRLDNLVDVEVLLKESISLLDMCISSAESYLPTPRSIHHLVYELVRNAPIVRQQKTFTASPTPRNVHLPSDVLVHLLLVTEHYESQIVSTRARTAKEALQVVAKEVERNGLYGARPVIESEQPIRYDNIIGFSRFACIDGMTLMS